MPRTSRSVVEFSVGGKKYIAAFTHEHAPSGSKGLIHRGIRIKHVTTCHLVQQAGVTVSRDVYGESFCSMKDTYLWRVGIKRSFIHAVSKLGIWPPVYDRACGQGDQSRTCVRKAHPLFGDFMREFFVEMGIKPTNGGPRLIARLPVTIKGFLPEARLTGSIPYENMHGLGYSGAD